MGTQSLNARPSSSDGHRRRLESPVTPLGLRHATIGYPVPTIRAAVVAGLRKFPFTDLPNESGFAPPVEHWLTDSDS
jgi:hypothetical protein